MITPYKFKDEEYLKGLPTYIPPEGSVFQIQREGNHLPLVYYFSRPQENNYPIIIILGGSEDLVKPKSIIHTHRYFIGDFLSLGLGVLTIENEGVTATNLNKEIFRRNYLRSRRLEDHELLLNHLEGHPPPGWNGKIVLFGISEGGIIAEKLTELYPEYLMGTIEWSGTVSRGWDAELWEFIKDLPREAFCSSQEIESQCSPLNKDRLLYEEVLEKIKENPSFEKEFLGMTYAYHADALRFPLPSYKKLNRPYFILYGREDSQAPLTREFGRKAQEEGVHMDIFESHEGHQVRKDSKVMEATLNWLQKLLR